jgi:hypothetical protein
MAGILQSMQSHLPWGGASEWRGVYAAAITLFVLALTLACYSLAKRWSTDRGLHAGALVAWLLLTIASSVKAPGASYLFAWPVLFGATAALLTRGRAVAEWISAAVTLLLLASLVYGVSVVMLGVIGTGAIALGVLTSLIALLLAPLLTRVAGDAAWSGAPWLAGVAVAVVVVAAFSVRRSAEHPVPTALVYAENADSSDAWFGSFSQFRDVWTKTAVGQTAPAPQWINDFMRRQFVGRKIERVPLDAPKATLVRDTLLNGARRVVLRLTAPSGTTGLSIRASGAPVSTASIDGRVVDTTRYRRRSRDWVMEYWAVPDSGVVVALSIPAGAKIDLHLTSRRPGIPSVPGLSIPARPPYVVPIQSGDASYVYRRMTF